MQANTPLPMASDENTRQHVYRCHAVHLICLVRLLCFLVEPCIPFSSWTFFVYVSCTFRQTNKRIGILNLHTDTQRTKEKVHRTLYHWLESKQNLRNTHQHTMPPTKTINACSHTQGTRACMHWPTPQISVKKLRAKLKRCYCFSRKKAY